MKWIKRGLLTLFGLILLLVVIAYGYLKSTLPDYEGEITADGILSEVEVIRDSFGMPHIYAKNDNDAHFALGYSMAQDRLFHMDLVRRAARGRLAEILGKSLVEVDTLFRTITAGKSVEEIADQYPQEVKAAGDAFAAGFNHYLKNPGGPLPIEFTILGYQPEPWKFSDGVAVHYYMAWDLNGAFSNEMRYASVIQKLGETLAEEIFPGYPSGYPTIIPEGNATLDFLKLNNIAREKLGVEGGGASNNWVISGKKSTTGMPILSNDPHLGHGAPGIWYEAHLVTPTLNVSGSFLPGIPYVVIGANEHVAWGFTNVMADDTDFYVEKINPENPDQYEFKGKWETMKIKEEVIKVKGGEDVTLKIRLTGHGPLIDDVNTFEEPKNTSIAMHWSAYEKLEAVQAFKMMNQAASIDDMEKAVEYFKCPGQNWVYADDQGNIGYWAAVGIPLRENFTGVLPLNGWEGKEEWKGYAPTIEQPHLRNPERGWIATANNRHVGDEYPHVISHYYAMPDRFMRIQEMLTEKEKLGVEDFERMLNDFKMILAQEWVPIIQASVVQNELSSKELDALKRLGHWDFVARVDSVESTIFHTFINKLVENTFKNRLGDDLYGQYLKGSNMALNALRNMINKKGSVWFDDPGTAEVESMQQVIGKSFKDGVAYLEKEMGDNINDWGWGKIHTLTIQHPFGKASKLMGFFFNIGPYPMGGSIATVNPQPYRFTKPWDGYHGASLRYIVDFADRKNSKRIIPAGISGNFMSPHYDDQAELWRTGKFRPFVLDRESIESDSRYVLKIQPQ
ncbi:penicillin acylase family protein [bacterium]|nr:penicillin acylase family protein [bacterium]